MSNQFIKKKYKVLINPIEKVWEQISFWTHSDSIEMPNGKSLTTNLGDIHGISDDITIRDSHIISSTRALNDIKTNIESFFDNSTNFYFDYHNGRYGWNESETKGLETFHQFPSEGIHNIDVINANIFPDSEYGISYWNFSFLHQGTNNISLYEKFSGDIPPLGRIIPEDINGNYVYAIVFNKDMNISIKLLFFPLNIAATPSFSIKIRHTGRYWEGPEWEAYAGSTRNNILKIPTSYNVQSGDYLFVSLGQNISGITEQNPLNMFLCVEEVEL